MARQSKAKADAEFREQYPYLTDKERFLIGWPGYRTRPEKSGLAPVETQAELAHIQGLMLHWLLTGRFRTRNPIYLALMIYTGLGLSFPIFPIIMAFSTGEYRSLWSLAPWAPLPLVGLLLLFNVSKCIFGDQDWDDIAGEED